VKGGRERERERERGRKRDNRLRALTCSTMKQVAGNPLANDDSHFARIAAILPQVQRGLFLVSEVPL